MAHLGYEKRAAMNIHGIQNGIMELTVMGFAAEQAQKALQETGGNQEAAIELLLLCDVPAEEIIASTTGSGSEADSAVNAIDSQASAVETFDLIAVGHDTMAENGVDALSDGAETDDYSFVEVSDLGEASCQWEYVHEAGSNGDAAGVPTVGDDSLEHFYDASEASDCYLTEGAYQHVDAHVSLLDRAQVLCSQSLSAVRSKVPEITHHVEHPTSHCSETHVPFVQEGGFEATTSGEVMGEKTPKAGTIPEDVAPHAFESHDLLAESAETHEELSVDGSTESSVACTYLSAAATSRSYPEQTYVNATRADRAQVLVSLSASALRSGLSAMLLQSRAIAA